MPACATEFIYLQTLEKLPLNIKQMCAGQTQITLQLPDNQMVQVLYRWPVKAVVRMFMGGIDQSVHWAYMSKGISYLYLT